MPGPIHFRRLTADDLPLLHEWLQRPHVRRWWGDPGPLADTLEHYRQHADPGSTTCGYLAFEGELPIGFIQSYVVLGSGDGWWPDETDLGARGIDQFVCDGDRLGQGLGSTMVAAFVCLLFDDPAVTRVQTDPSPDNGRAIGCCRRAGFEPRGEVDTPDGRALLMVIERPR